MRKLLILSPFLAFWSGLFLALYFWNFDFLALSAIAVMSIACFIAYHIYEDSLEPKIIKRNHQSPPHW